MPELLSPGWIAAADAAVVASALRSSERLILQSEVTFDDGSTTSYHVEISPDGSRVHTGTHPQPTVTYRLPFDTAEGIASGALDPYAELMSGRLEISGDSAALVANQDVVEALQEAIATAATDA